MFFIFMIVVSVVMMVVIYLTNLLKVYTFIVVLITGTVTMLLFINLIALNITKLQTSGVGLKLKLNTLMIISIICFTFRL